MDAQRREELAGVLGESAREFQAAVASCPAERISVRPSEGCWSVLEIVEHVALAERGMLRMLQTASPLEAGREDRVREATLAVALVNRGTRTPAPERVHPTGRFASLEEALASFTHTRGDTIRYALETETNLLAVEAKHPFFGAVNGCELLVIMAGHARRHAAQIAGIRDAEQ